MKKFIFGFVIAITIMSCDNATSGIPEVPAYKPEDGLTFIGKWSTKNNIWEFTITDSSNIYVRRNNRDATWVGTYKLSDQSIGNDGMIGQYEEGIITYTVKNVYGEDVLGVDTYKLTKEWVDLWPLSDQNKYTLLGGDRYFRVN